MELGDSKPPQPMAPPKNPLDSVYQPSGILSGMPSFKVHNLEKKAEGGTDGEKERKKEHKHKHKHKHKHHDHDKEKTS